MKTCRTQDATISTCFVGVMRQHSCLTPSRGRGVARGAVAHPSPPAHISSSPYRCVSISEQTRGVRERLFKECLSGGLLYLEAGDPILRNGSDVFHPFRADSNFLYVTGVNQPGFGCLLDAEAGACSTAHVPSDGTADMRVCTPMHMDGCEHRSCHISPRHLLTWP